jgi:hypothetical protein
VYKNEHHNL